jgi:hypothetical protein
VVYSGSLFNTKFYIDGVLQTENFMVETGSEFVTQLDTIDTLLTINAGTNSGGFGNNGGITGFIDDVRIYNRALTAPEVKTLFFDQAFTESERGFLAQSPELLGHYSQVDFEQNRNAGRNDVLSNPESYNLYTTSSIMDLNLGGVMLQKLGGNVTLNLELQKTDNLGTIPFSHFGNYSIQLNMPQNKSFLRVRAQANP